MHMLHRLARVTAATAMLATLGACQSAGNIGSILGSVLGQGQGGGNQVSGMIQGVDGRSQQIYIQQQNGQTVTLSYDRQTQVSYQNRSYPVSSLERGDQVTARIQQTNNSNGGYYTDLVQVDQSASSSGGASGTVQTFQGTVRGVDSYNNVVSVDLSGGSRVTLSLPQQITQTDYNRFRNLRAGDYVRFYGVVVNNSQVELRQFY